MMHLFLCNPTAYIYRFLHTRVMKRYLSLCCSVTFLRVHLTMLCCNKAVLMVWLGLSTKTTWFGLGKDHVLVANKHD